MALAKEQLVTRVESVLSLREKGDFVSARAVYDTLTVNDIPDIPITMSNGITGDRNVLMFYINLDWDNDYADSFLVDLLNAVDGTIEPEAAAEKKVAA